MTTDVCAHLARAEATRRAGLIEEQLLTLNHVEETLPGGQRVLYDVPRWRDQPVRRARIAWYRWRVRRRGA